MNATKPDNKLPVAQPTNTNNKPATTPNQNGTPSNNKSSTNQAASESALNSVAATNNTTPISAGNNFEKELNKAEQKAVASNKELAGITSATNNSAKLVQGLNTRVKTSEDVLAANNKTNTATGQDEGGIFNKITTFAKNAAKNIMPTSAKNSGGESKVLQVEELGNESDLGSNISIVANTENYIIILGVFIVIILVILIYFFSKTFNVSRTLDKMKMYQRYQKITGIEMTQQIATESIYKFQIASSYNSCHSGNQMFSYTSELITKSAIRSGARYLEFNVFSSIYGPKGVPVVDSGYARGEWKLMLNTTTFESVIRIISENAFRVAGDDDGAPNNTDPLFIGLNLSTGGNTYCLDLMADILTDYFRDKLLDAKYAFQFATNFGKTPLRELENKVIIFSSTGFEGSRLEELVNAVWYDEIFAGTGIVAGSIEGFQDNTSKSGTTSKNAKYNTKINKNKFTDTKTKKTSSTDQLSALKKSLNENTSPISKAAKKSNKSTTHNGISDSKITSEQTRLTQNIKSLADELKESGLEILDVDELRDGQTLDDSESSSRLPDNPSSSRLPDNPYESLTDIPSPTTLGLDQVLGNQTTQQAQIMRVCAQDFDSPGFDGGRIQAFIQSGGIVIVVPHREGDFITRNYEPQQAFELGCQFIAMNYQEIDGNMDKYITRFESKAILPIN